MTDAEVKGLVESQVDLQLKLWGDRELKDLVQRRVDQRVDGWSNLLKAGAGILGGINVIAIGLGLWQVFVIIPPNAADVAVDRILRSRQEQLATLKAEIESLQTSASETREKLGGAKEVLQQANTAAERVRALDQNLQGLEQKAELLAKTDPQKLAEQLRLVEAFLKNNKQFDQFLKDAGQYCGKLEELTRATVWARSAQETGEITVSHVAVVDPKEPKKVLVELSTNVNGGFVFVNEREKNTAVVRLDATDNGRGKINVKNRKDDQCVQITAEQDASGTKHYGHVQVYGMRNEATVELNGEGNGSIKAGQYLPEK